MLAVLLVCAAPVVASYLTYFVIRPQARTNYSELILPPRALPVALPLTDLRGHPVAPASLYGQWLIVVVSGGACDVACERRLWLQRQLHETLGREKLRVDKLWLVDDDVAPSARILAAIGAGAAASGAAIAGSMVPARALLASPRELAAWLAPAAGRVLSDHIYVVDPQGNWMMRAPADPEPARLKKDLEKLLRASAGWDQPGR
ncbi:MAG: hypothetical protein ABIO71_08075 [Caldimonas sp.]